MTRSICLLLMLVCWCPTACRQEDQHEPTAPADPNQKTAAEVDRLRSLPYADFSNSSPDDDREGVVRYDAQRSCPGYNLCVLQPLSLAELLDEHGNVIHSWRHAPSRRWSSCELLPSGDVLAVGADVGAVRTPEVPDELRYLLRLTWAGEVVWKLQIPAHHDVELTPAGRVLTLTFSTRSIPAVHATEATRDDQLTLVSLDGRALEHCPLYEVARASPAAFTLQEVGVDRRGQRAWVDLFHANSVEWMHRENLLAKAPIYAPGNVLVCMRHQDCAAIIDWDAKRVVWSWGQGEVSGPHDATTLENGHILLFDNGLNRSWSRVIELDPLAKTIVWEYRAPRPEDFYTHSRGACQRLPNGNTLITNSGSGQAFEVMPDGEIVWDYWTPHNGPRGGRAVIARMKRYERAYVDRIRAQHQKGS